MLRLLRASDAIARRSRTSPRQPLEFPFRLRRFGPGELEEVRRRDQTPTDRKSPPLRPEIDDWRCLWSRGREAPSQLDEFVRAVFQSPNYRSFVRRPDVLARLQVRCSLRPSHGNAGLAERREIIAVWDVIAEVVAHARVPQRLPESC